MIKAVPEFEDYTKGLKRFLEHPELTGYVPSVVSTMDVEIAKGVVEECVTFEDMKQVCLGIIQADRDSAIHSPELLAMVPGAQALFDALERESEIQWTEIIRD